MAEKKARRYTVDFEQFENATLTTSRIAWEAFLNHRFKMPGEKREQACRLLKRFTDLLQSEVDLHPANYPPPGQAD